MAATFADYLNTLKKTSAQRIFKVQVLDKNENIIDELSDSIIDGNIQLSSESGSQRIASIVFENTKLNYFPSPDSYLWIDKKFRILTGLKTSNGDYYISRGIFICSEPEITADLGDNTVSLQLNDKWSILDGNLNGTLDSTYKIEVGQPIEDIIIDILTIAGDPKPPIIAPINDTVAYANVAQPGETYADIILKLANSISYQAYYDENGYFRFEPPSNIEDTGSSFDFTVNEIFYINSKHRYEFSKIRNNVLVVGSNVNGITVKATASDTNIDSPTSILNIGKKTLYVEDSMISTVALATDRANSELLQAISLAETTDVSCMPIDFLSGGQIITITDPSSNLNGDRFLIKSINFPLLTDGTMSLNCWKGRKLDNGT